MAKQKGGGLSVSRRNFMTVAGAFVAGGIAGCAAKPDKSDARNSEPPPLPWKWAKLDPHEAGRRAYRGYFHKPGG
jgi:hypothetical protein